MGPSLPVQLSRVQITKPWPTERHNWWNYVVKCISDDADLIKKFKKHHNLKVINEEDEEGCDNVVLSLTNALPFEKRLLEGGDSNRSEHNLKDSQQTSCNKAGGKRFADADGFADVGSQEIGERSINKPVKMKCIKVEKDA